MHGADGLHTTGSTRAPQPQHTKEAQDTVASRAPQPQHANEPEGIVASRAPWPQHANEPQTARACPGAVRVARHRPASPVSCAALQCTSRGTAPRARRARRAAPARRRVPRWARHTAARPCRALRSAPGVVRAHAARARRVPGVRRAADLDNLQLAPVCILSQPNRMETGARYEYRSLISRISQPTFAKMARSPNLLGQWRRSPGGDGPQIW